MLNITPSIFVVRHTVENIEADIVSGINTTLCQGDNIALTTPDVSGGRSSLTTQPIRMHKHDSP
jgi:hypothetical protein